MNRFSDEEITLFLQMRLLIENRGFAVSESDLEKSAPTFKYFRPGPTRSQEGIIHLDANSGTGIMSHRIQARVPALYACIIGDEFFPGQLNLIVADEERIRKKPRRSGRMGQKGRKSKKTPRGPTSIQLPQRIHSF